MRIKLYPPQAICELGKRSNQEDCIYPKTGASTINDRLFILCDGMGGHERGEEASGAICRGLATYFKNNISADDVLKDEQLLKALEYAYVTLDKIDDGAYRKAGTTMTLLFFHRGGCTAAHIGDSRIYHLRPSSKSILYKSRDHSLVFELYQMGEISYKEMKTHPRKNQISRAMIPGVDNRQEADIVHITDIQPNDYFFLCSDGIMEQLEDEDLLEWLSSGDDNQQKCQKLARMTSGNDDNHSAYLVQVSDVEAEAGDKTLLNDEQTVRFNAQNIHPVLNSTEDDIKVVSSVSPVSSKVKEKDAISPTVMETKKSKKSWISLLSLILLAILIAIAFFFFKPSSPTEQKTVKQPQPANARTETPIVSGNGMPAQKEAQDKHVNSKEGDMSALQEVKDRHANSKEENIKK